MPQLKLNLTRKGQPNLSFFWWKTTTPQKLFLLRKADFESESLDQINTTGLQLAKSENAIFLVDKLYLWVLYKHLNPYISLICLYLHPSTHQRYWALHLVFDIQRTTSKNPNTLETYSRVWKAGYQKHQRKQYYSIHYIVYSQPRLCYVHNVLEVLRRDT